MTERTFTPYSPGKMDYPPLPARLKAQFDAITPCDSVAKGARPCKVILEEGTVLETVYVAPAQGYIDIWGVWPKDDRGKNEIDISKVTKIAESPRRLPKRFTDKLYRAGEDGMGYCLFTAVFKDGSTQAYLAGGALDFIPLPAGKLMADIVDVIPHEGRNAPNRLESLDFHWCLFGVGESRIGSFKVEPPL